MPGSLKEEEEEALALFKKAKAYSTSAILLACIAIASAIGGFLLLVFGVIRIL